MKAFIRRSLPAAFLLIVFLLGCSPSTGSPPHSTAPISSQSLSAVISRYRQEIPQRMDQDDIPGLAIAIVDDQGLLWMEGFGYTDWDRRIAVTPDTLFSIQSMSKSFTATAALFASQDGLVDLDAPITNYLPDFHVNSIFEDHPEQKITLRLLLSHTAGLTHEAPYGGNYDLPAYSFEKHIASISDTWLRFPVGKYYAYSNLGVDLAGYILQVRSEMPFTQYVQEKVLQPLGMDGTTLDLQQVRATPARAIGHLGFPFPPPVDFLIIPSGGVWTTAADMARYLQFHINEGALDGQRLLQAGLAETMYTPPNLPAGLMGYGLGIAVDARNGARHYQHGGGGFGFNSSMVWYPDLRLGSVVLTNSVQDDSYAYLLSEKVLDDVIATSAALYAERARGSVPLAPAYPPHKDEVPLTGTQLSALIAGKALPADASTPARVSQYLGKYIIETLGIPGDTLEVRNVSGSLAVTYLGSTAQYTEVQPGLFFSPTGVVLDLRGPGFLFDNIHLVKVSDRALIFRETTYSIFGLLLVASLLFWPSRRLSRRMRRSSTAQGPAGQVGAGVWRVSAGIAAGISAFVALVCLAVIAMLPNLIFFPWPRPYAELTAWQHGLLYLPYLSLIMAVLAALFAGLAYKNRSLERLLRIYFPVVILASLAFNLVILIG